jgi:hypothetical protein
MRCLTGGATLLCCAVLCCAVPCCALLCPCLCDGSQVCEPLSPIEFNNLWLLCDPSIHTLVVGAAFPSDFDDHVASILKYEQRTALVPPIEAALNKMLLDAHGAELLGGWSKGLPDIWGNVDGEGPDTDGSVNPQVLNVNQTLWMWMIAKAWDFVGFGRYRYAELEGNAKNWDDALTPAENIVKQESSWNPGLPMPVGDLSVILAPLLEKSAFKEQVGTSSCAVLCCAVLCCAVPCCALMAGGVASYSGWVLWQHRPAIQLGRRPSLWG